MRHMGGPLAALVARAALLVSILTRGALWWRRGLSRAPCCRRLFCLARNARWDCAACRLLATARIRLPTWPCQALGPRTTHSTTARIALEVTRAWGTVYMQLGRRPCPLWCRRPLAAGRLAAASRPLPWSTVLGRHRQWLVPRITRMVALCTLLHLHMGRCRLGRMVLPPRPRSQPGARPTSRRPGVSGQICPLRRHGAVLVPSFGAPVLTRGAILPLGTRGACLPVPMAVGTRPQRACPSLTGRPVAQVAH